MPSYDITVQHKAAAIVEIGSPLSIIQRDTTEPGENEILIEVMAIALNPVDQYQRDRGVPPSPVLPAISGSDIAGVVLKVGPNCQRTFKPGARVMAVATSYYHNGDLDYGAFQERCIVRSECVCETSLRFEEAAILPLATITALSGYTVLGFPLGAKHEGEAIPIWGGSSSVGSIAVQSAKAMGWTVYATAGAMNIEYVRKLGADVVFDYRDPNVVSKIVTQAKNDNIRLRTAHVIVDGALQQTLDVLKQTKNGHAKVAHAPLLPDPAPKLEDTEIKWTNPPSEPEAKFRAIFECFDYLTNGLKNRTIVPSPRIRVISGGLNSINKGLDELKAGVSATKLVVLLKDGRSMSIR